MNGVSTGVVDKVVHPTFLYELLWNLLIVVLLVQIDKHYRIGHGRLFALYVAGYCVGRFFVELMRADEATKIAGIRINSFTSALVFLAAVAYFVLATKGRETAEQLQPSTGSRPWPWQIAALRAAAAAQATAETSDAASTDENAAPQPDAVTDKDTESTEDTGGDKDAAAITADDSDNAVELDKSEQTAEPERTTDAAKDIPSTESAGCEKSTEPDRSADQESPAAPTTSTAVEQKDTAAEQK